jgi:hypothetical protein
MINEITIMQKNKNIFNKVTASLNKYKNDLMKAGRIPIKIGHIDTRLSDGTLVKPGATIKIVLGDIITVKEKSSIFFCTKLNPKVMYNSGEPDRDKGDLALDYIRKNAQYLYSNKSWQIDTDSLEQRLKDEYISDSNSDSAIKLSNLYKELRETFNQLQDIQITLNLREEVYKRLSIRENIMPLIVYDIQKDSYQYCYTHLGNRSINSTFNKNSIGSQILISDGQEGVNKMCENTVTYTPYSRYTEIDKSNIPDKFTFLFY